MLIISKDHRSVLIENILHFHDPYNVKAAIFDHLPRLAVFFFGKLASLVFEVGEEAWDVVLIENGAHSPLLERV